VRAFLSCSAWPVQSVERDETAISLLFSGEESYGKYLDLYANHSAYSNLKNIGKRPGYLQYLDLLISAQDGPVHRELAREVRLAKDYELYVVCFRPGPRL
jgi:splicing factor 3A subunit 3